MTPLSRESRGFLLGCIAVTLFGGVLPMTRLAVADFEPIPLSIARAALGGLAAACGLLLARCRWPTPDEARRIAFVSATVVIGFPVFTTLGMVSVPAAHGGVVLGLLPLTTAIIAALFAGERPSPAFWALSALGAAIVIGYALRQGGGGVVLGDMWLLAAVLCAASGYSVSAGLSRAMPGWAVISWALAFVLPLSLTALAFVWPVHHAGVAVSAWMGFLYISLISQYLAFFAWNSGLALGGVARVAQLQLLQPFITIGLAALVASERIDAETLACAALVLGVVLLSRQVSVRRKPS